MNLTKFATGYENGCTVEYPVCSTSDSPKLIDLLVAKAGLWTDQREIDLTNCCVTSKGLAALSRVVECTSKLSHFSIAQCKTNDSYTLNQLLLALKKNASNITNLDVSENEMDETCIETLGHIVTMAPHLTDLSFASCSDKHQSAFEDFFNKIKAFCSKLQQFDASNNNLVDTIDALSVLVSNNKHLKTLNLGKSGLKDYDKLQIFVTCLSESCQFLTLLDLSGNSVHPVILCMIKSMATDRLHIKYPDLSTTDDPALLDICKASDWATRTTIDMSDKKLTPDGVLALAYIVKGAPKLTHFKMSKCHLNDTSKSETNELLENLSSKCLLLEELDASHNSLHSTFITTLSECVKNMKNLKKLSICSCNFSAKSQMHTLVTNIDEHCQDATHLDLSGNRASLITLVALTKLTNSRTLEKVEYPQCNISEHKSIINLCKGEPDKWEDVKKIDFSGVGISPEGTEALAAVLQLTHNLEILDMSKCNIKHSEELLGLVHSINKNALSLQKLDLSENNLGNQGMLAVAETVISTTKLEILDLSKCQVTDGASIYTLGDKLRHSCSELHSLNLSHNNIGTSGLQSINNLCSSTKSLEYLCLAHAGIEDDDALLALIKVLTDQCPLLQRLDLQENVVGLAVLVDMTILKIRKQNEKPNFEIFYPRCRSNDSEGVINFFKGIPKPWGDVSILHWKSEMVSPCGLKALTKVLPHMDSLKKIIMAECKTRECTSMGALINAIGNECKNIEVLDFSGISLKGCVPKLTSMIEKTTNMKQLLLPMTDLDNDEGIKNMVKSLVSCKKLEKLDLRGNQFHPETLVSITNLGVKDTLFPNCSTTDCKRLVAYCMGQPTKWSDMTSIDLSGENITECGLSALSAFISKTKVSDVHMSRCGVANSDLIKRVMFALPPTVLDLDMSKNSLGSSGIKHIADAVNHDKIPALQNCNFEQCSIEEQDAVSKFVDGLKSHCPDINSINLSKNVVGKQGAKALCEMLQNNPMLKCLNLNCCSIEEDDDMTVQKVIQGCNNKESFQMLTLLDNKAPPNALVEMTILSRKGATVRYPTCNTQDGNKLIEICKDKCWDTKTKLDVSCDTVTGKGAAALQRLIPFMKQLKTFCAAGTKLREAYLNDLVHKLSEHTPMLESLDLSDTTVRTEILVSAVSDLQTLKKLKLLRTIFTGKDFLSSFADAATNRPNAFDIEIFDISNVILRDVSPKTWENVIRKMPKLQIFNITNSCIEDTVITQTIVCMLLQCCQFIKEVKMSGNKANCFTIAQLTTIKIRPFGKVEYPDCVGDPSGYILKLCKGQPKWAFLETIDLGGQTISDMDVRSLSVVVTHSPKLQDLIMTTCNWQNRECLTKSIEMCQPVSKNLRELNFSNNAFARSAVKSLQQLLLNTDKLITLNIAHCGIKNFTDMSKVLENLVDGCSFLQSLDISGNPINQTCVDSLVGILQKAPHLKELLLGACDLQEDVLMDDFVTQVFKSTSHLKLLNLAHNNVKPDIYVRLGELKNSTKLMVHMPTCRVDPVVLQIIGDSTKWKNLPKIDLNSKEMSSSSVAALTNVIKNAPNLKYFSVANCGLCDSKAIENIQRGLSAKLEVLNLSNNKIGNAGVQNLSELITKMTALKELHLSKCGIDKNESMKSLLEKLSSLKYLEILDLSGNNYHSKLSGSYRHLNKRLKVLRLAGCGFTDLGKFDEFLKSRQHLELLDLCGTKAPVDAIAKLTECRANKRIDKVIYPECSSEDCEDLIKMCVAKPVMWHDMTEFILQEPNITSAGLDAILIMLPYLSKVEHFTLVKTKLVFDQIGNILTDLQNQCPAIKFLDLSENVLDSKRMDLVAKVITAKKNLKSMTMVNVYKQGKYDLNKLFQALKKCNNLKKINLMGNKLGKNDCKELTQAVPDLKELEEINLENCKIDTSSPMIEFANSLETYLTKLKSINLLGNFMEAETLVPLTELRIKHNIDVKYPHCDAERGLIELYKGHPTPWSQIKQVKRDITAITQNEANCIATVLRYAAQIEELLLTCNSENDDQQHTTETILQALEVEHSMLKILNLSGNTLSNNGVISLISALKHVPLLQHILFQNCRFQQPEYLLKLINAIASFCKNLEVIDLRNVESGPATLASLTIMRNIKAKEQKSLRVFYPTYRQQVTAPLIVNFLKGKDGETDIDWSTKDSIDFSKQPLHPFEIRALGNILVLFQNVKKFDISSSQCQETDVIHNLIQKIFYHCSEHLEVLNLSGNNLGLNGACAIGQNIKQPVPLTHLILADCQINEDGKRSNRPSIEILMKGVVTYCPTVKVLDLSRNTLGRVGAEVLSNSMKYLPNIQQLCLSKCALGAEGPKLKSLIESIGAYCNGIELLDLSENALGFTGMYALANIAKDTPQMAELYLQGNKVDDKHATKKIVESVTSVWQNLVAIDLSGNTFPKEVFEKLEAFCIEKGPSFDYKLRSTVKGWFS